MANILRIVEKNSDLSKKTFTVFTGKEYKVGDKVEITDQFGNQVGQGRISKDFSEDTRYQKAKKRIGSGDIEFNSGYRYYQVKRR